jgi:hypothetical protein
VKKFFIVLTYFILISLPSRQQMPVDSIVQTKNSPQHLILNDSARKQVTKIDSVAILLADSIVRAAAEKRTKERIEQFQRVLSQHPALPFDKKPVESNLFVRKQNDNEALFYFLVALVFYFGCIRLFFGKYLDNLITLFFRVSMRQQQIREQLLQTPLPSLLLNILFVITSGFYLSLLARHYDFNLFGNFWITFFYAIAFVSGVYLGKYLILKLTGWIFNIRSATDTYIFIVFLVNKMIGIFLLPFIILMAFPNKYLLPVLILLSYIMLLLLLGYRFINSFRPIRTEIKVNRFHFFLYLCAFEIAPLLLIYKVLLAYVERST